MLEAFHDVLFPPDIALGSRGGPTRRTQIVELASGQERRTAKWSSSRRRYDAGVGLKNVTDLEEVVAFFEARQGRRYAFRWRDPFDSRSSAPGQTIAATDQIIGTGDGTTRSFDLLKTYQSGAEKAVRRILLPDLASLVVALDGVEQDASAFVWSAAHQVELAQAPAISSVITAGFAFDVPVRFDTDELSVALAPGGGTVPNIPVVEVLS